MKKKPYNILIAAALMLLACSKNNNELRFEKLDLALSKVLSSTDISSDKYCVIIPKAGCSGCIEGAVQYVKEHVSDMKGAKIIFTGVDDRKLLAIQMGKTFLEREQVYLDSANLFNGIDLLSDYPQVVFLEDGHVSKVVELDTSDPETLRKLK